MINMQDFIEDRVFFKKFQVDDLLFVEFQCPTDETTDDVWWHNNMFAYILTGEIILKSLRREYILKEKDCIFAKKGSITIKSHMQENFCELMIFLPDNFIRSTIQKYGISISKPDDTNDSDILIPLSNDEILDSYFHSLAVYFAQPFPPDKKLLKLKFEELIINIISNKIKYSQLISYFNQLCHWDKPPVQYIMEENFPKNLSLEEYSRLCARSLSSFKNEFKKIFHTTPGKWLHEKRLDYAKHLLESSRNNLDEICILTGFENKSHFIRSFKNKFNTTPGKYRIQSSTTGNDAGKS